MTGFHIIAVWGIVALGSAIAAGILAAARRRDHSWWAAWTFVFPPMLIALILTPKNDGPRPKRPSLDDEDRHHEATS